MRRGNDTLAQAARILSGEVRHVDVRTQQALSDDGETAQPRTGRCRNGMREVRWNAFLFFAIDENRDILLIRNGEENGIVSVVFCN